MSVDPGDGYRLLVDGEVMPEKKEFLHDDGKWVETRGWTGVTFDSKQFRPCRVKITVTTSGPYVSIDVHRAALAEIERLKAELDAVKQAQPEPEPEWFDLTPFGEHVLRPCMDHSLCSDKSDYWYTGVKWPEGSTIAKAKTWPSGWSKFRCLLKDAPPELVAMASKPEWPKYYTTDDLSGSRIAYIIRCSQSQYQMMTTNGTVSENVFFWGKFDDETRTEISKEKADAILEEKRLKAADSPEKPKTETEREVLLYWYDGNVVGRYADCPPTDQSFIPLIVRDGKVFVEIETREVGR